MSLAAATPTDFDLARLRAAVEDTRAEMAKVVIGQDSAVSLVLVGLIAGGHVLLEGPPGVGKTLMVRSLAAVTGLSFARIQFTPDLMPGDITGGLALVPDPEGRSRLEFRKGPIFAQLLLADEINRATPRTQSALLEAMQEGTVTAAGRSLALPTPFFVLATQNPVEMDGTYTLPEAQIDRFLFRIDVAYPDEEVLSGILAATTGGERVTQRQTLKPEDIPTLQALARDVPIAPPMRKAVARFCLLTQGGPGADPEATRCLRFGLSPRGAQALVLAAKAHALIAGRHHVSVADLRAVLAPVVRHRVQLSFEGRAAKADVETLTARLFEQTVGRL